MIASLNGKLVQKGTNEIILSVNGVGYRVFVTKKVLLNLPAVNEDVFVITYLDVKETSLTLYGFSDEKEREIFKLLCTVSGISSRSAHTILSYAGFEEIIGLINNSNSLSSVKIPGIGSKKIEMISLALKDKVFKFGEISSSASQSGNEILLKEQSRLDAFNALMNLGYTRADAEKIIREVLKQNPDTDFTAGELIKKSLEYIS